jgi:hypothetical protein
MYSLTGKQPFSARNFSFFDVLDNMYWVEKISNWICNVYVKNFIVENFLRFLTKSSIHYWSQNTFLKPSLSMKILSINTFTTKLLSDLYILYLYLRSLVVKLLLSTFFIERLFFIWKYCLLTDNIFIERLGLSPIQIIIRI